MIPPTPLLTRNSIRAEAVYKPGERARPLEAVRERGGGGPDAAPGQHVEQSRGQKRAGYDDRPVTTGGQDVDSDGDEGQRPELAVRAVMGQKRGASSHG